MGQQAGGRGRSTTRHACAWPVAAGLHPGASRTLVTWRERVSLTPAASLLSHDRRVGCPPEEFVAYLKSVELRFPGLEYVHVSNSMGTPQSVMLEQLAWFAKEVKPAFTR